MSAHPGPSVPAWAMAQAPWGHCVYGLSPTLTSDVLEGGNGMATVHLLHGPKPQWALHGRDRTDRGMR